MILIFLVTTILWLLKIYSYAMILYILLLWVPFLYNTWFFRELAKLIQPYLNLLSFIRPIGMLDLRPLVGLILLDVAQYVIVWLV